MFEQEIEYEVADRSARHGFTVRDIDPAKHPGCAYHELAANRAWAAMLGLLGEVLT